MATTYTTTEYDKGSKTAKNVLGSQTVYDRFTQSAAFVINDVVRSVFIPKNAVILDGWVLAEDFDTHSTPLITVTLRINDGSTQKNFCTAETIAQGGGIARADLAYGNAVGYEVGSSLFFLELLIAAAPATGTTDKSFLFCVTYTMDRIHADL